MSFISQVFWLFAIAVWIAYALSPQRYRWWLLLAVSYLFYAYWDWRYLPLLLGLTLLNYLAVLAMCDWFPRLKKPIFLGSISASLGTLFFFKYWNFAGLNFSLLFDRTFEVQHILLPLGISFYIFQSLSYLIDAYQTRIKPERHFGYFALFVSFFPQLVAGPIERSQTLLPQLKNLRPARVEEFRRGILLIIWGVFLKLAIADNLTQFINGVYFSDAALPGWLYWFAGALVSFKIYCDFMAYSEIARGLAQLFGVKLTQNFRRPFLARDLHDFWQRWHISLTRWIGAYVQLPLIKWIGRPSLRWVATILTMTLIGLWHGAGWNFIIFGLYHGLLLAIWAPSARIMRSMFPISQTLATTFSRMTLAFVLMSGSTFFYLTETATLQSVLLHMFDLRTFVQSFDVGSLPGKFQLGCALMGISMLTLYSILSEFKKLEPIETLANAASIHRYSAFIAVLLLTITLGNFNVEDFVYFEF